MAERASVSPLDGQPRDFYVRQLRDWKFSVDAIAAGRVTVENGP